MIADISPVLQKLFFSTHVCSVRSESVVMGELTESYTTDSVFCGVLPLNGKELKSLPEGEYSTEDVIVLVKGDSTLKLKDRIIKGTSTFELRLELDVSDIVGIKKFIGKKLWA